MRQQEEFRNLLFKFLRQTRVQKGPNDLRPFVDHSLVVVACCALIIAFTGLKHPHRSLFTLPPLSCSLFSGLLLLKIVLSVFGILSLFA